MEKGGIEVTSGMDGGFLVDCRDQRSEISKIICMHACMLAFSSNE